MDHTPFLNGLPPVLDQRAAPRQVLLLPRPHGGSLRASRLHHGRNLRSCHSLVSLSSQVRAIPGDIGFSVEELEDLYMVFKVTANSKGSSGPILSPMHPHAAARLHVVGGSAWSLGGTRS